MTWDSREQKARVKSLLRLAWAFCFATGFPKRTGRGVIVSAQGFYGSEDVVRIRANDGVKMSRPR